MERNRLYFAFFDSRKPLEILNFSDGRFQNGIPISRPPRYDRFGNPPDTCGWIIHEKRGKCKRGKGKAERGKGKDVRGKGKAARGLFKRRKKWYKGIQYNRILFVSA